MSYSFGCLEKVNDKQKAIRMIDEGHILWAVVKVFKPRLAGYRESGHGTLTRLYWGGVGDWCVTTSQIDIHSREDLITFVQDLKVIELDCREALQFPAQQPLLDFDLMIDLSVPKGMPKERIIEGIEIILD